MKGTTVRGVGTLSRIVGKMSADPRDWAAVDDELRRLKEQEEEEGSQGGGGEGHGGGGGGKRLRLEPPPQQQRAKPPQPQPAPMASTHGQDGVYKLLCAVVSRAERAAIGAALGEAERQAAAPGPQDDDNGGGGGTSGGGTTALALEREPRNPADRNAIKVVASRGQQQQQQHLGYLPRTVAGYLGPLLDSGLMRADGVVTRASESAPSAVEVRLSRQQRCPGAGAGKGESGGAGVSSAPGGAAAAEDLERDVRAAIDGCLAAGQQSLVRQTTAIATGGQGQQQQQQQQQQGDDGAEGDDAADVDRGHAAAFGRMLADVRRYDAHLLSDEEARVFDAIGALDLAPRRLLLRLLTRRSARGARWVLLGSLDFPDVGDVPAAARALAESTDAFGGGGGGGSDGGQPQQRQQPGLVRFSTAAEPDWHALLSALTCDALKKVGVSVLPRGHPALSSTKDALVSSLAAIATSAATAAAAAATAPVPAHEKLHRAITSTFGQLVQVDLCVQLAFRRLQRIFFLNEGLDFGVFLASERGAVRYPAYAVRRSGARLPFASRRQLLEYERALADAAALDACLEQGDLRGAAAALRPALEAVQERGVHKAVAWQQVGPRGAANMPNMPNLPPPPPPPSGDGAGDGAGDNNGNDNNDISSSSLALSPPPPPLFLARFSAAWVYTSMATVGVSLLEKEKRHREAVELLQCLLGGNACPARRGEWWSRMSTNLEAHLKDVDAALEVAEASLADSWVRLGDRVGLQRRVARLCKPPRRWKRPPWAHAVMADPPEVRLVRAPVSADVAAAAAANTGRSVGIKTLYRSLGEDEEGADGGGGGGNLVTVEGLALQHYASTQGWQGTHSENGIWGAFFVIFMWPVLFADVADVFRSPFQTAPLDLDTDAFYPARLQEIERRLQEVAAGDGDSIELAIRSCWAAHGGTACRGISWARWDVDALVRIARSVGALGMSVVLRLMAEDHAGSSGGMPDLLLWRRVPKSGEGGGGGGKEEEGGAADVWQAKMVEVKSKNDRLSDQQRMWISALSDGGWDVEVLKVVDG